jgi:hypothetical protein
VNEELFRARAHAHAPARINETVRQHILDFQTEHKLKPKNGGANFINLFGQGHGHGKRQA